MKKLAFILIMLTLVQFTWAQKKEWSSPFVGYSTTKNLTLDKVEFDKSKTLLHVTATASGGSSISVSPDAYLSTKSRQIATTPCSKVIIHSSTDSSITNSMPPTAHAHFRPQTRKRLSMQLANW